MYRVLVAAIDIVLDVLLEYAQCFCKTVDVLEGDAALAKRVLVHGAGVVFDLESLVVACAYVIVHTCPAIMMLDSARLNKNVEFRHTQYVQSHARTSKSFDKVHLVYKQAKIQSLDVVALFPFCGLFKWCTRSRFCV